MEKHTFSFPTLIHFGPATRHDAVPFLKQNGISRPLIVTDSGVAGLSFFHDFAQEMSTRGMEVGIFAGVHGNPTRPQVNEGVAAFRAHQADAIVGLGGGAALDVAKAVALMAEHPGDLFDYEDGKVGARPMDRPIPLWIALPTTSGTGSEVGRSTVISHEDTHIKKIIFSPRLLAKAVFADPEFTLDLPAKVTAATGMDALTHCVESYLAKGYHPICDGIALEGTKIAAKALARSVHSPNDIEARSQMMMASLMGAIAFQKGLGLTHSCAHALGTAADLHHGLANGLMIDHALKFNLVAVPERFREIAVAVGLQDLTGGGVLRWLESLKAEVGIPARLSKAGISPTLLPRLAQLAFEDSCHQNNPRPCVLETFTRIFEEAF